MTTYPTRYHRLQALTAYELRHGRAYRADIAARGLSAALEPYAVPVQRRSPA